MHVTGGRGRLVLRAPAEPAALRAARGELAAALERTGWEEDDVGRVLLAAGEALVNAVEHGSVEGATVDVSVEAAGARARVEVCDRGRPGARYPRGAPAAPAPGSTRGRGRLIMAALADRLAVRAAGPGSCVTMEFDRAPRPDAAVAVWSPCPTCWGQRRIYEDRNGEGLVPVTCPDCLGLAERLHLEAVADRRSPR